MAEAIVSIVLDQLVSLAFKHIEEKASLVTRVDKEVENLILHFSAIQGVLQDAEERQVAEANVRNWVANLEDLSYQINDLLDDWNTEILRHKLMIDDSKGDDFVHTKRTSKVRFLIPSARICFGKVDQLVMRRDIAKRIREINEKLTIVATVRQSYQFQITKRGTGRLERSITSSFVEVSHIIGREKQKKYTIDMLMDESSTSTSSTQQEGRYVISIPGMGGLGKTAFAQSIYENERVKAHFDQRIWVCVSDPFDHVKISKEIAQAIKTDAQTNLDRLQSCLECISGDIRAKKFLLVLDDVWTPTLDKWEPIKNALQNSDIGSRILVTTRKETAGITMGATNEQTVRLDKLSKEDSLELFRRTALFNQDDKSRFFNEGMMTQIVEKCAGLPLAIKTLASIIRYKKTEAEWVDVLNSKMWELDEVEEQVFQPLLLSYYDLTPVVRCCLLYCAIFPKDSILMKKELIEHWMYQGYLGVKGDNRKETTIGQTYFDNLVMRSFFQDFYRDADGNIVSCKMHDVVHDFVQFLAKNECVFVEGDNESKFVPDNKVHHLNIRGCSFDTLADSIYNCKRLRTLLASRSDISKLSSDLILQWNCLRTLELGSNQLEELPEEIGKLVHLRYLNLEYCHLLIGLPYSVGNLYNLETLNLNYCEKLKTLPVTVRKLTNLKHLLVDNCPDLKLPKEVGRLYNLQTLAGNIPSNASNHKQLKLGDLRKLDQLRGRLSIQFLKSEKDVGEAKAAQLADKKYLSQLFLLFDREYERNNMDEEILNALQPHTNLESLSITGYGGTTLCPRWMTSLSNLKTIVVKIFRFCEGLAPLGKLPSLERLVVVRMNGLKTLGVEFLGKESEMEISFPKLNQIDFGDMREWEEWVGVEGERESDASQVTTIMPSLSTLVIKNCPRLKSLPDFLWKTPLKNLIIYLCPNILQGCESRSGAEWDKVSRIPNIGISGAIVQTEDRVNFGRMLF